MFAPAANVRCGTIAVLENRARAHSRTIRAAAVVPATARRPKSDPIVFLNGGPGFGTISPFALDGYFAGSGLVRDRDLILVDTRGTGISRPRSGCPELDDLRRALGYRDWNLLAISADGVLGLTYMRPFPARIVRLARPAAERTRRPHRRAARRK